MSGFPLDQITLRLSRLKDNEKTTCGLGQEAEQRRNTESHGNRPASCADGVFSTSRGSRLRRAGLAGLAGLAGGMLASADGRIADDRIADGRSTRCSRLRTVAGDDGGGGGNGLKRVGQRGLADWCIGCCTDRCTRRLLGG